MKTTPAIATETGEAPTLLAKQLAKRKAAIKPRSLAPTIPPLSEEDRQVAENARITEAFRLVEEKQKEYQARQQECWQKIQALAAEYGFQIELAHKPVEMIIDLRPRVS